MAKRGRPTKIDQVAIAERNKKIIDMRNKGFPSRYIAGVFGLSYMQVWKILDVSKKKKENEN